MKSKILMLVVAAVMVAQSWALEVTSVTVQQRFPWNGLVDVDVTLSGNDAELAACQFAFTATNCATHTAFMVSSISDANDTGVNTKRHFVWDARQDVGAVKIDEVVFVVEAKMPGVQLWAGGPYWAECNVGATKPEEAGYYFWWGDTVGYVWTGSQWNSVDGKVENFAFNSANCPTSDSSNTLKNRGYITDANILTDTYDAARKHLGGSWRMPTESEFEQLIKNCSATWLVRDGVAGCLFTGKGEYSAKSVFFPKTLYGANCSLATSEPGGTCSCGHYWSASVYHGNIYCSAYLRVRSSGGIIGWCDHSRYCGFPIRAVSESVNIVAHGYITLDTCEVIREADDTVVLPVDPAWGGATSGRVTCNGVEISIVNEAGTVEWTPPEVLERTEFTLRFVAGTVDYSTIFSKEATTRQMAYVEAMVGGFAKDVALEGNAECVSVADGTVKLDGAVIGDNGAAVLSFVTTRDGKLVFTWNVSSEANDADGWYDYGWWQMDDGEVHKMAGKSNTARTEEILITDGAEHTLRFGYVKDVSGKGGDDCLTIDNLAFHARRTVAVTGGSGAGEYYEGDEVTVSAEDRMPDWVFAGWTVEGVDVATDAAEVTFSMPDNEVSFTANYRTRIHVVEVVGGDGGGLSHEGGEVAVTADAAEYGAWFAGWTGDVACLADAACRETVLTVPERDVTVTATYADRAAGAAVAGVLQEAFRLGAGVATVEGAADAVVLTNGVVAIGGIDADGVSILGDGQTAAFSVMTHGRGTLSFKWLVSSEGGCDIGRVLLNGETVADGERSGKNGREQSVSVEAEGRESGDVWMFSYTKDRGDAIGEDVVRVWDLRWTPAPTDPVVDYIDENGVRKSLTVERAWLTDAKRAEYLSGVMGLDVATATAAELAAKLTLTGANGLPLWQSFVAGLEPGEAGSKFSVSITPGADGKFTLTPDPKREDRKYTVRGTDDLTKPEASWPEAKLGDERFVETNRFFRVWVEML